MSVPRALAAALLLAACVLAVHWPPQHVDFVFDDDVFVVDNPAARSVAAAAAAALQPFPSHLPARGLYRPLTALSYGFDSAVWGRDARGFAVTNALLYLAVVLLAWGYFGRHLPSSATAFAAALLFAAHPVHTEAVDAIAGRSELLALLFSLLALHAFDRGLAAGTGGRGAAARVPAPPWPWLSALAFALASAAKETAVVLPAILAAHVVIHRLEARPGAGRSRGAAGLLFPHLLVLAAYAAARWKALGGFTPARSVLGDADPVTRLATVGAVFSEYARLLVFPATLQTDGYYVARIGTPHALAPHSVAGWLLAAGVLLAAFLAARRLARTGTSTAGPRPAGTPEGALLRGLAILVVFLLPVSHLVPMGALMAERFLFAPSLGFVLALAAAALLLERGLSGPRFPRYALAAALAGVLVAGGAWRSRARALEWRDAVRLWESADRAQPGDVRVQTNLAAQLFERGDLDGAERVLRATLRARPGAVKPTYLLALIADRRGDSAQAAALFGEVLQAEPGNLDAHLDLARIEAGRGETLRAAALLARARLLAAGRPELERAILALERELAP